MAQIVSACVWCGAMSLWCQKKKDIIMFYLGGGGGEACGCAGSWCLQCTPTETKYSECYHVLGLNLKNIRCHVVLYWCEYIIKCDTLRWCDMYIEVKLSLR